jgi:putative GTP pyrophosphokinase
MMTMQSNTQIDRLGEQLKAAAIAEQNIDVEGLETYRLSFREATESVELALKNKGLTEFTQRPAKSTPSIIAKLMRQPHARLSQIQDIAGLRFIATNMAKQQWMLENVQHLFESHKVIDRRINPSNGYRAAHVVVRISGKLVEIQIRTQFQHLWAQLSEGLADSLGHELKYGGGDPKIGGMLMDISDKIHRREIQLLDQSIELNAFETQQEFKTMLPQLLFL